MLFTTPEQFIVLAAVLLGGWLLGYVSAPSPKKWKRRVREQSESFTAYHEQAQDQLRASHSRAANLTADLEALRADHAEAERTIVGLRCAAAAATPPAAAPVIAVPLPVTPPPAAPLPSPEPVIAAAVPEEPSAAIDHTDTPPVAAPPSTVTEAPAAIAVEPSPVHQPELEAEPTEIATAAPDPAPTDRFVPSPRDSLTRIRGIDDALQARLSDLGIVRFEDLEKLSAQDEMALEQRLSLPVGYVAREQWRPQAALLRAGQNADHAAHFAATEPAPL
jgi:predicted flap endonuclease-1-like 5' DNA nuclease